MKCSVPSRVPVAQLKLFAAIEDSLRLLGNNWKHNGDSLRLLGNVVFDFLDAICCRLETISEPLETDSCSPFKTTCGMMETASDTY